MKGGSPAPVRDGGAEAVDEQDWRALSPGEVVHAHPAPRPGGAAPAQLLQGQRRRRGRRGEWGRRAAGAAAARGARAGAETAMGRRPRGEGERGEAAASCWSGCGGEGEEAVVVVGGKCCHILRPLGSVVVAGVPFLRLLSWHDHARGRRVSFTYSTFGHLKLLKNS